MTDTDREYVAGEGDATDNQRLQSVSRVRSRITNELPQDIDILEEHHPGLLGELRDVVCLERTTDGGSVDNTDAVRLLDELEAALERGERQTAERTLDQLRETLRRDSDE